MKNWKLHDIAWDRFDRSLVDPAVIPLIKAASMVERNAVDYAIYLGNVFTGDPEFSEAARAWSIEEVQHGESLGQWGMLADPEWDFPAAFARFRAGFQLPLDQDFSVRGSRTGELIARCIVETGTSSYYTALGQATREPVLQQICHNIAADEFRHYKMFYTHMRRYLVQEKISLPRRMMIGAGRITESEDDELSFAYHCGNEPPDAPYDHARCLAAYMAGAVSVYKYWHIERGIGMVFKAVGLKPRGMLSNVSSKLAWRLLNHRRRQLAARVGGQAPLAQAA